MSDKHKSSNKNSKPTATKNNDKCNVNESTSNSRTVSNCSSFDKSKLCPSVKSGVNCRFGGQCRYLHPNKASDKQIDSSKVQQNAVINPSNRPVCVQFTKGNCSFGDTCRYFHDVSGGKKPAGGKNSNTHQRNHKDSQQDGRRQSAAKPQDSSAVASRRIIDFWSRLHSNVAANLDNGKKSFDVSHEGDRDLWMSCWQAAAAGAVPPSVGAHLSLLKCYRNLANLAKAHPCANNVVQVLQIVVNQLQNSPQKTLARSQHQRHTNSSGKVDGMVSAVTCVLDVVRDRLSTPESLNTLRSADEAEAGVKDILRTFLALVADSSDERCLALLDRLSDFNDYIKAVKQWEKERVTQPSSADQLVGNGASNQKQVEAWLGWRDKPTVGWLMSEGPTSWHHVPDMQNMYSSEAEYAETLLRVWTLLTFYWGSGAIWPRCSCKVGGNFGGKDEVKTCGEPLLAACNPSHSPPCTSMVNRAGERGMCGRPAVWRCHKMGSGHSALCGGCVRKQQDQLCGQGGLNSFASTDIYDAVVDREVTRRDGVVFFLSGLQSRRPPRIDPNWKTSYRLTSSSMVAVVRLSASNEPLSRSHSLQWAEIANYSLNNGPKSFADTPEFTQRAHGKMAVRLLSRGDCGSLPSDADSPLEPGTRVAIIDLRVFVPEVVSVLATFANPRFTEQLKRIPFMGRLVGTQKSLPPIVNPTWSYREYVHDAIHRSEIECVKMMAEAEKGLLVQKICELAPVKSLYGTQLEAFANALYSSIHCTQGPPGTGKSYVGVCLVLALMIIRESVRAAGTHVGPILMLSYKNHALDEFLVDVLHFAPDLKPAKLIRSGKSDHPALLGFGERNSNEEKQCQQELTTRIATQQAARKVSKTWLEVSRALNAESRWGSASLSDDAAANVHRLSTHTRQVQSVCASLALLTKIVSTSEKENATSEKAHNQLEDVGDLHGLAVDAIQELDLDEWFTGTEHWRRLPTEILWAHQAAMEQTVGLDPQLLHWLDAWLRGLRPPPRCAFSAVLGEVGEVKQCLRIASEHGVFCGNHCCQSATLPYCQQARASGKVPYCADHSCQVDSCAAERYAGSSFCAAHTCPACLSTDGSLSARVGAFACVAHQCRAQQCSKLKLLPHDWCEDHCCYTCVETGSHLAMPRCALAGTVHCLNHKCSLAGCVERISTTGGNKLCARHTCRMCAECVDVTVVNCSLCPDHHCAAEQCARQRTLSESGNLFCADHSCKHCLFLGKPTPGFITDNAPRNVCESHPLCQSVTQRGTLCDTLASANSLYCVEHQKVDSGPKKYKVELRVDGFCCGVTKKGNRCPRRNGGQDSKNPFFCPDHIAQKAAVQKPAKQRVALTPELKGLPASTETEKKVVEEGVGKWTGQWDLQECEEDEENEGDDSDSADMDDSDFDEDDFAEAADGAGDKEPDIGAFADHEVLFLVVQCCVYSCAILGVAPVAECAHWRCPLHTGLPLPRRIFREAAESRAPDSPKEQIADGPSLLAPPPVATAKVAPAATPVPLTASQIEDDEYDLVNDPRQMHDREEVSARLMDADEMDMPVAALEAMQGDNEAVKEVVEEQEGNEELLRRQQLGALSDSDDDEVGDCESTASDHEKEDDVELSDDLGVDCALRHLESWSWAQPLSARQLTVSKFMRCMSHIVNKLRLAAEDHVMAARKDRAEASAAALKNAKVVGATVVGASRRLEAIRAAEPFAVVVEEACEVMEPTLMSVLAVGSLKKLELVGDHRQLPAAIQQYWYNLESALPSIKTSLFERLITGTVNDKQNRRNRDGRNNEPDVAEQLSCTVLDEQRRMRASIADITRPDYDDIVGITDHEQTAVQRIGDAFVAKFSKDKRQAKAVQDLQLYRSVWPSGGRHVPGLRSNIFFWNLKDHKESRPQAGLSACNEMEANAISALTKYLLLSGVPPGSITVITPYKGQKNLIIKTLRDDKCLPSFKRESPPTAGTVVTVSTVDNFQGDENDIVILSLVRSRPGNRFVALLNRFIVAVSRARLGFYIVGSVDAVVKSQDAGREGPAHWNRFIGALQTPMLDERESNGFTDSRVGNAVPICCPVHSASQPLFCQMSTPREFPDPKTWNSFCREKCTYAIPCGHQCGLSCHSPELQMHTKVCKQVVDRPCEKHRDVPLLCRNVPRSSDELVADALRNFKCDVAVVYNRPECDHSLSVTCSQFESIAAGKEILNPCLVKVSDFHHPVCGHITKAPLCHVNRSYSKTPPQCAVNVLFSRPCGCVRPMTCADSNLERSNPPVCKTDKISERPRCRHKLSLQCYANEKLQSIWTAQCGGSVDVPLEGLPVLVEHGECYGPSESTLLMGSPFKILPCNVPVHFRAKCDHIHRDIPCDKAFSMAIDPTGASSPRCVTPVSVRCPVCLHCDLRLPCWSATQISELNMWGQASSAQHIPHKAGQTTRVAEVGLVSAGVTALPAELMHVLKGSCTAFLEIARSCVDGHTVKIDCQRLLKALLGEKQLSPCVLPVDRQLDCMHVIKTKCYLKTASVPPCRVQNDTEFHFPCGEHSSVPPMCVDLQILRASADVKCGADVACRLPRCGHQVTVPCHNAATVRIGKRDGQNVTGEVNLEGAVGKTSHQALVVSDTAYCSHPIEAPECSALVSFQRTCKHIEHNVSCKIAFAWAAGDLDPSNCSRKVSLRSPLCGHDIKTECWAVDAVNEWQPWAAAEGGVAPVLMRETVLGRGDCDDEERLVISAERPRPQTVPRLLRPAHVNCNELVTVLHPCGHSSERMCLDAFLSDQPLVCQELLPHECPEPLCRVERRHKCHEFGAQIALPCDNLVTKVCTVCQVNSVELQCCMANVECQRHVTVTLACGHDASFLCGVDPDPRDPASNVLCRGCMLPQWKQFLEQPPQESEISDFNSWSSDAAVRSALPRELDILSVRHIAANLTAHCEARKRMFQRQVDHMLNNDEAAVLPVPPPFASAEDRQSSYDLVFVPATEVFGNKQVPAGSAELSVAVNKKFSTLEHTVYGSGVKVRLLTKENLRNLVTDHEGTLLLCVGVAHHTVIARDKQPFAVGKKQKAKARAAVNKANRSACQMMSEGFSCVAISKNNAEGEGAEERVYWTPGAVVPLAMVRLKLPQQCQICSEQFVKADGCCCVNGHFLCWKGCFKGYVDSASTAGAIQGFTDEEGNLLCPEVKCKKPYDLQSAGNQGAPPEVFKRLQDLKIAVLADKKVKEALEVAERKRRAEEARIAAIADKNERDAERLRMKIVDDVLTLRCPRANCKTAFMDFDGCFALSCSACRCGFCAWCLKDCGPDAHQHVPSCPENQANRSVYSTPAAFKAHHLQRRKTAVERLLAEQSAEVREKVMQLMRRDLADLGIEIGAQPAAAPQAPVARGFGFGFW